MNYKKIYDSIIRNRKLTPYDGYVERHHIIPRSLGGSDDTDNIVALTAREHFVCHCLLAQMYPKESFEWYKMNHAFMMMKCESMNQERYFNSRLYESLKGNFASVMSFTQRGQRNSQYGSMWICNVELQENKKIAKTDDIPDGWIKGRNIWNKSIGEIESEEKVKEFLSSIDLNLYIKLGYRNKPKIENFDAIKQEIDCYKFLTSVDVVKDYKAIIKMFPLMTKKRITKLLKLTGCTLEERRGRKRKLDREN